MDWEARLKSMVRSGGGESLETLIRSSDQSELQVPVWTFCVDLPSRPFEVMRRLLAKVNARPTAGIEPGHLLVTELHMEQGFWLGILVGTAIPWNELSIPEDASGILGRIRRRQPFGMADFRAELSPPVDVAVEVEVDVTGQSPGDQRTPLQIA